MNRFLLGVLFGGVLGAALGFVAFSGSGGGEALPVVAAGSPAERPAARAAREAASLIAAPDEAPPQAVSRSAPSAVAEVPRERVAAAAQRAEIREVEREAGTAAIEGKVVDPEGTGIPGVVVRAFVQSESFGLAEPDSLGAGPPPLTLDEAVQSAADRFARRRAEMSEAVTGADGSYRLEGLPERGFSVAAYKDGWWIVRSEGGYLVAAPGTADFEGKRVVELPVSVLSPDGSPAEEAILLCDNGASNRNRLAPIQWSRERATVRLPADDLALTAVADVHGGRGRPSKEDAGLASEEVQVDLSAGAPGETVVLQLVGRLGIRGRITARGPQSAANPRVMIMPLGDRKEPDLELLEGAETSEWVSLGSSYAFMDLTPGRYAVGVTRSWNSRVEAHRVVELTNEVVVCDLELPEPDLSEFLVVDVLDPAGTPLTRVEFQFIHSSGNGSSSFGIQPVKREHGRYYLDLPGDTRTAYFGAEANDDEFLLRVEHDDYGRQTLALRRGQLEASVTLVEPARLSVVVPGYDKSSIVGRASLRLNRLRDDGTAEDDWWNRQQEEVSSAGNLEFGNLVPGRYRMTLQVRPEGEGRWARSDLTYVDVDLRTGANEARMAIPDLYSLTFEVTGEDKGHISLDREADPALQRHEYGNWKRIGDVRRVTFNDLLPGDYRLTGRIGDKEADQTVSVPSGDVTLDPSTW